jgi:hypothetical protein
MTRARYAQVSLGSTPYYHCICVLGLSLRERSLLRPRLRVSPPVGGGSSSSPGGGLCYRSLCLCRDVQSLPSGSSHQSAKALDEAVQRSSYRKTLDQRTDCGERIAKDARHHYSMERAYPPCAFSWFCLMSNSFLVH